MKRNRFFNTSAAIAISIALNTFFCSMQTIAAEPEETYLDFRKETIYFLFLDRFSDGDPSNNAGFNSATYDPNNLKKYTGGDLRGLINKLPYLKSLGVTSIWITPPIDNVN
ncbi:TPA: alpha-amylase family glycosyl hydrolase, partial [Klebsiella oxytoca]